MHGQEGTAGAKRGSALVASSTWFLGVSLLQSKYSGRGIDKTEVAGDGVKLYNMDSRRIHLSPARVSGILAQPHSSPTGAPENRGNGVNRA